jgi:hypothetical protein
MTQSGYRKRSIDQRALHVDAATAAAVLALQKAQRGIYNIAEPSRAARPHRRGGRIGANVC